MIVHLNYHSSDSNEDFSDNDSEPSDASSGVEADQAHNTDRHTVTFKVIGCTKETIYQSVLVWARNMIEEHSVVEVKLQREPNNPYDPNAVCRFPHSKGWQVLKNWLCSKRNFSRGV